MTKLERSKLNAIVDSDVFCFDYIFSRPGDKNRFDIIIQYVLEHSKNNIAFALGHIFSPSMVVDAIENESEVVKTEKSFKKELGVYFQYVRDGRIVSVKRAFFDDVTHYYCEKTTFRRVGKKYERINIYRYFETLDAFLKYRNGDLTNTDISSAPAAGYDFSNCRTDSTSKLPVTDAAMLDYYVMKKYIDRQFKVEQIWKNDSGVIIKNREFVFDYFFDFVTFLNGDLSWADLITCDGLANLVDITNINLDHAKITSSVSIKLGLPYTPYHPREEESFDLTIQNERRTEKEYLTVRDLGLSSEKKGIVDILQEHTNKQVNYISDIHLGHRLLQENVRSWNDVEYVIRNLVDDILSETKGMLLINGDVASDFKVFKLFVQRLGERKGKKKVVFTLGNYELWDFTDKTWNEIVSIYTDVIMDAGMILLQNAILYENADGWLHMVSAEEILSLSPSELKNKCRNAKYIIFGGIAFSGYNTRFNADNGIYRNTISREKEIKETLLFETLYHQVTAAIQDKPVIIMTHMPKKCWCADGEFQKKYIYVSGHTHRNMFYDDGEIRIYADNQIGYKRRLVRTKWFYIDTAYDYFYDYKDGIYNITSEQYKEFFRGIRIRMDFNRDINTIYMLKKSMYYLFICESRSGTLSIMNGGALKRASYQDIQYYYDNMEKQIAYIKKPLMIYTSYQKRIAEYVKNIGGQGSIHGCIIDIDYYCHLFINPFDGKVTAYSAEDMKYKLAYPSFAALLEMECPLLYANYKKALESTPNALKVPANIDVTAEPVLVLETTIYKASREIRKLQKLNTGVLAVWYEVESMTYELTDNYS